MVLSFRVVSHRIVCYRTALYGPRGHDREPAGAARARWAPTPGAHRPQRLRDSRTFSLGAENYHGSNTVFLVAVLMSVVGGVFIVFALSALCYRKKSTLPKYDPPYVKKPNLGKSFPAGSTASNNSQEDISLDGGKMHSFNNTFSRGDSQRVIFKHGNHMSGAGSTSRYP
ncbi:hypothetical protein RR46_02972 [Papilio xuthus]|uniref:Uncharacterized protein n=1 Tax=Papilio xuthus TaxID=66420 RepID=A0A194Q5A3_PAPXU|nr:hypothetical protein RR46_02972 [Papilio xuthus]